MAEFPSKVSTQTSTPESSGASHGGVMGFLRPDVSFLRSIPGILMLIEICFGLLAWALVADSHYHAHAAYGWVMFVFVFCWLVTLILYVTFMLNLHRKLTFIPWSLTMFIFHVAATALYITAFITCAASVSLPPNNHTVYNKRAAASFFACVTMIAYAGSTYFSIMEWRGSGASTATPAA
ncbi:plasmolipin [Pelodytes ibericus]